MTKIETDFRLMLVVQLQSHRVQLVVMLVLISVIRFPVCKDLFCVIIYLFKFSLLTFVFLGTKAVLDVLALKEHLCDCSKTFLCQISFLLLHVWCVRK